MKTLYLIGGTMGVGKTTVCKTLKSRLPKCVFLDGDWCWDADPFQVTEETKSMVLDNICHMLSNFIRCFAYENIVFCWVMHEQSIIDDILSRLDTSACKVKSISLVCEESELRSHLEKDVALGLRSLDVIERSVLRIPLYARLNTVKVDVTGKTVLDISEEIEKL